MVRKILVVRTDKMGDVILATPVLEILRNIFYESHIAMLVQSYTEDIIRGNKM